MKDAWISCYLDTKYLTVLKIEKILHNFEDQKFDSLFNLEQVDFHVALVIYVWKMTNRKKKRKKENGSIWWWEDTNNTNSNSIIIPNWSMMNHCVVTR